jgi:hypothetical protein
MAQALESLMTLAPKTTPRHPVQRRIAEDLVGARFCYDHLAGKLGVAIADSLVARGAIELRDATANVTAEGTQLFRHIGIAPKPCRPCLDWSERRPHLAGPLAAALAKLAMDRHWVVRKSGTRAVTVTALGRTALREIFEVSVAAEAS